MAVVVILVQVLDVDRLSGDEEARAHEMALLDAALHVIGLGAAGTGCSLVGFVVPSNYNGPLPLGLKQSDHAYPSRTGPPCSRRSG